MSLRPATAADADLLLEWRNDPETRSASFNADVVPRDTHLRWLERRLRDEHCALLIVELAGEPVGQVRLERDDEDPATAEIHIALDRAVRGRSIGRAALRAAVALAPSTLGATHIRARVKPGNEASLRAFQAAGFRIVERGPEVVVLGAEAAAVE